VIADELLIGLTGALFGLVVGSFLATLVLRWPQERDLGGRSGCDSCGAALRWTDLVPLVSFILKRGKCSACGAPIDPTHPVIELLCALVGGVALFVAPDRAGMAAALIGWLLVALAALDLRHFWLPDRLTGAVAVVAVASCALGAMPPLTDRLIGGVAGFAALAAIAWAYRKLRHREGLGGGDPKLFGAIGLWLGWEALPFVLLGASGVGLLAVAVMMLRGKAVAATTQVPFGTLLAIAAFPVWVFSR
jgi:leader peptidase (prepilin peptidase)/N-methyltransferase